MEKNASFDIEISLILKVASCPLPKKEEYFLGRGHEATFKISDISISRVHAKFYLKDENIVIDDLGSKFGTLLLVRKNINVTEMIEKKMKIQIGRSVLWVEDEETEKNK